MKYFRVRRELVKIHLLCKFWFFQKSVMPSSFTTKLNSSSIPSLAEYALHDQTFLSLHVMKSTSFFLLRGDCHAALIAAQRDTSAFHSSWGWILLISYDKFRCTLRLMGNLGSKLLLGPCLGPEGAVNIQT
mmetsp:Transcript_826/g.5140  ORF Transcript_826/g.5140 Transcript_826/m.5140 type:complete len:131 (-) Transcript_826:698-1090(-)